jgi:hypothetical protein
MVCCCKYGIIIIIIIIIYYLHGHKLELNWIIIIFFCLFAYLLALICCFLKCLPLISLWFYVVFVYNVITCIYTVLCL